MPKPYVKHPVDLYSSYSPRSNAPHPHDTNPYAYSPANSHSPTNSHSPANSHSPTNSPRNSPWNDKQLSSPRLQPRRKDRPNIKGSLQPSIIPNTKLPELKGGKYSKNVYKKVGKKEVLGKDRVIYKMKGSNKEYLKTKGMYIPVSEYKKLKK